MARLKDKVTKRKGRGFGAGASSRAEKVKNYESVDGDGSGDAIGPQKCKKIFLHSIKNNKITYNMKYFVYSC